MQDFHKLGHVPQDLEIGGDSAVLGCWGEACALGFTHDGMLLQRLDELEPARATSRIAWRGIIRANHCVLYVELNADLNALYSRGT